jgi:polyhydroxybutyrate depolymerase
MRWVLAVICLAVMAGACASGGAGRQVTDSGAPDDPCSSDPAETGLSSGFVLSGGNEYPYQLYVPTSRDQLEMPLVLNFHGLGSSGPQQEAFSLYGVLAEAEGFVVVAPTGLGTGDPSGRPNWELAQFAIAERDDVAMVGELIDEIASLTCIDAQRVYATGMSNGGLFSSLLACRLADRLAATFSVSGISHPPDCRPSQPISVGAIHGTADEVVRFSGGGSVLLDDDTVALAGDFFDQVMPAEAAEFAADFSCSTVSDTRIGSETTLRLHGGCEGGVEVRFYSVEDGGHTWPGSPIAMGLASSLGYTTTDFDATRDGWEFMSGHTLDE